MIRHAPSIGLGLGLSLRGSGVGFTGLLDSYPGAAAAYSLRALSAGWLAGDVVEVRRSSDSTTQDFTAGQITNGAMLDFVNVNSTSLYNDIMYFDGVNDFVELDSAISLGIGDYIEASAHWVSGTRLALFEDAPAVADFIYITDSGSVAFRIDGTVYTHSLSATEGTVNTVRVTRTASSTYSLSINGNSESKSTANAALSIRHFGGTDGIGLYFKSLLLSVTYNTTGQWLNTGNTNANWLDQIGSNNGTVNGSPELYTGQPFDGFVSTWYDQSGNGNDSTQATTTAQPKIVDAGSLVLDADGNTAIQFDGTNDRLDCGARIVELSQNAAYVCAVSDRTGLADIDASYMLVEGDVVSPYSSNFILGGSGSGTEVLWVNSTTFGAGTSGNQLLSFTWNGTNQFQAYIDGATSGAAGSATVNAETSNTFIGCRADQTINFSKRKITELITWKSDQSANRAGIETNINDHYNIYA